MGFGNVFLEDISRGHKKRVLWSRTQTFVVDFLLDSTYSSVLDCSVATVNWDEH